MGGWVSGKAESHEERKRERWTMFLSDPNEEPLQNKILFPGSFLLQT